ncbi:MAG TPA: EfeM/EfeO family lipoprotein [Stellaceae bacterium]|nr:EfeM/EfeO family lipoprotein [Stellaceae bacterium]
MDARSRRRCCRAMAAGLLALQMTDPVTAATLEAGLQRYVPYAVQQIDAALAGAERMRERIALRDVDGARRAWIQSHAGWERAEPFTATLYPDLDDAIDAWPDAKAGYHAVEAKLFAGTAEEAEPIAAALAGKLREFAQQIRARGVTAQGLLDGSARLAFEIGENKAAGGESAASGTSLDDMRNNLAGIAAVWTMVFAPALRASDPAEAESMDAAFAELEALLRAGDLKTLDQSRLAAASERLALAFEAAAPKLGLAAPSLGD